MAHLVLIVLLLTAATVTTGIALPPDERNGRRPRDAAHDPIAAELARSAPRERRAQGR